MFLGIEETPQQAYVLLSSRGLISVLFLGGRLTS